MKDLTNVRCLDRASMRGVLPLTAASAWSMLLRVSRRRDELRRSSPLLPMFIRKILVSYSLTLLSHMSESSIPATVTIFFFQTLFVHAPGRVSTISWPFITRFTSTSALRRPGWSRSPYRPLMVPVNMTFACSSLASSGLLSVHWTRDFSTELSSESSTAFATTMDEISTTMLHSVSVAGMATLTVSWPNTAQEQRTNRDRRSVPSAREQYSVEWVVPAGQRSTDHGGLSLVKGAGR